MTTKSKRAASVTVIDRIGLTGRQHLKMMKSSAAKSAAMLSLRGELSVAVVGDTEMREMHRAYKKIARTTDVLTFEQNEKGLIGDVVISIDTARRRARKHRTLLREELKRLVVHGVCHLAGHTHKKKKEAGKMRAEESRILQTLAGL